MNNLLRESVSTRVLSLILIFLSFYSCNDADRKQLPGKSRQKVEYSPLVYYATEGNISSSSEIIVEFRKNIELIKDGGDQIQEDIFKMVPNVGGKVYWRGKSSLAFVPDKALENGKDYHIILNMGKLFVVPDGQKKDFEFDVSVIPLRFYVSLDVLSSSSEKDENLNYINGKLHFSDKVDYEKAKTLIGASQKSDKLDIVFADYLIGNALGFRIIGIKRMEQKSKVIIKWDGSGIYCKDSGIKEIRIPSKNIFEVTDIKLVNGPDQYAEISFSDPIDKSLNPKGIIYIVESPEAKYIIDANRVLIYPDKYIIGDINVVINKEIRSKTGRNLAGKVVLKGFFGQLKPAVRFLDDGAIMPGKDKWLLTFEAVNLSKVDVIVHKIFANNIMQFMQMNNLGGKYELSRVSGIISTQNLELMAGEQANNGKWNAYQLDLRNLIKGYETGVYRVQIKFKKEYSLYECEQDDIDDAAEYSYYQSGDYYKDEYYYPEGFQWYKKDDPCSGSYYYHKRFIQKNVLPSNIGLTLKGGDGKDYKVFATDLITARPISGLSLSIFNYQQQLLEETKTDGDGFAVFKHTKEPWLVIANRGDEYSYLKISDASTLSFSRFNTKGIKLKEGIKAYIYGDRGVWRPGDTLFLTMMVEDMNNEVQEQHPASVKLFDPLSKLVSEQTIATNKNGFYSFRIKTSVEDITGLWIAKFRYGGSEFSKRLRIEDIKPNRLKINLSIDNEVLKKGDNHAELKANWLHGGIAGNLRATVNATIRSIKTSFDDFPAYNFDDVGRYFKADDIVVLDTELDSRGEKGFYIKLPSFDRVPGELKVSFVSRVFEKGGDFSIDQISKIYSPYDYYIGLLQPDAGEGNDYLEVDKPHKFKVVTVDANGKPVDVKGLQVEVYRMSWSWWYGSGGRSAGRYINKDYYRRVYQSRLDTKNGKADFDLNISYPEWGRFYVNVFDPENGHSTGSIAYLDWPSWYSRKNRKGAEDAALLSLTTDNEKYSVGDTVKISLPTGENSNMLVSLESDTKILDYWWQETTAGESLVKFVATKEMSPNIYAYISVIQPYGANVKDVPIRKYGLVPIMVEDKKSVLLPQLEMAGTIRPNSTYGIKVSEKNGEKMTYTIAVVDEGLLDLTHFRTPDPHSSFYAKQALFVQTWDIFSDVMSAYIGKISQTFAIGGSDEIIDDSPAKKKANRFKAVVTYLGPFSLEKGETAEHKLLMPNYIGSVRVMLIAGNQGAYGKTDKSVSVKQPLMVLATLPRILAPGEKLKLPVSVFILDDKIKNVRVKLIPDDMFICKDKLKTIKVDKIGEKDLDFDISVDEVNGIGKIKIELSSGNESAYYELEVQVRNPNERIFDVEHKIIPPASTITHIAELIGQKGSNELNISISAIPQINLERRLEYLIRYPYGCIEQTTSSVFPQLYLNQLVGLTNKQKNKVDYNINFAIDKILRMQMAGGGFSYWQGGSTVSDWGSSYAGHFLVQAEEKGYLVSHQALTNWIAYQKKASDSWTPRYDIKGKLKNDLQQAYRLFSLALAGKPNISAMNRLREIKNVNAIAKYELAASYALAGQKRIAMKAIANIKYLSPNDSYWYYNYGSELRDKAMIINALNYIDREQALALVFELAEALKSNRWYSTQTTAFSLSAISQFYAKDKKNEPLSFSYTWANKNSGVIETGKPIYSVNLDAQPGGKIKIENTGSKEIFLTVTASGIPKMGAPLERESKIGMELLYKDMDGKLIDPGRIKQGTDFYAEIKITNNWTSRMRNLALSQVFPSGWEIINSRLFDLGAELKSDPADYVDFRDDRVNFFFVLRRGDTKKFIVLLNASYKGEFYLPAASCSDMYDKTIEAVKGGGWVRVE
ncbi:MAG: hypothetical protein GXO88_10685 [Chlorobi bacterium]|nr:hypothetical protein [Chlorobiota bacterium]